MSDLLNNFQSLDHPDLVLHEHLLRRNEEELKRLATVGRATAKGKSDSQAQLERLRRLKEACANIESLFLTTLVKTMRQTVGQNGLLTKQTGSDVYESIYTKELATHLANGRGMGLGQAVFNQMIRREGLEDAAAAQPLIDGLNYRRTIPADQLTKTGPQTAPTVVKSPMQTLNDDAKKGSGK